MFSTVRQSSHTFAKASVPGAYRINHLKPAEAAARVALLLVDDNYLYGDIPEDEDFDISGKVRKNSSLRAEINCITVVAQC
jgi:hypothetical protein